MPFGITNASEVLQKWTYKTFGDIPNVHIVADDMLIVAKTEAEHSGACSWPMCQVQHEEDAVEEMRVVSGSF